MKFLMTLALLTSFSAFAKNYTVGIKGMHCESCVEKITLKFKSMPEVESVKIDLNTESMTLMTKKDKELSEKTIKTTVADAGYSVTAIK
ncbi:MAG: heavy-metal-associated domain-containing protein [Bacteriovoracaceae bacterium]